MASSNLNITTYNVDKNQQKIINLSDLFKDNKYIEVISNNIKEQMRRQMKADENIAYFIDSKDMDFKTIKENINIKSLNLFQGFF